MTGVSNISDITAVTPPGAILGEGATWDPARGVVWWVDIKGYRLHAHHVESGRNHVQALDARLTALALTDGDDLVAAGDDGFVRLSIDENLTLRARTVIACPAEPRGNRYNDGAVDSSGRFWAGTMDDAEEGARGTLYRLDPDRSVAAVRSGIMVPNGPAFLADGTMLATDTATRTIAAVTLDACGTVITERVFAQFGEEHGYPDGMAVDAQDHVWIAFWDGWCLRRLAPDGTITETLRLPVQRPTRPVFAGERLDRLFVTSATVGLTREELAAQPDAGALLRLTPGVIGRAPHRYAG